MTVQELIDSGKFTVIEEGEDRDKMISKPFCCDLLSICMSRLPAGACWITVMGNINTLAVASLTEASCIILAENAVFDEPAKVKAKEEGITVLATEEPIYEAAQTVASLLT